MIYDPQVEALSETTWTPGKLAPSPTFIGRVPRATYDAAYHIHNWGMRSTQLVAYEAPAYTFKSNQLYPIKKPQAANIGTQQGAAPTSGIYTGVPASGCGPGGMSIGGGNPYS